MHPRRIVIVAVALCSVASIGVGLAVTQPSSPMADAGDPLLRISRAVEKYSPSPIEQAKAINGWIYESIGSVGLPRSSTSITETLSMLDGTCANRADLAAAISTQLGLKTRRVNFYGVPVQVGHSAWEVLIDGKWRFFDSLFGVYFARPSDPETPISIDEARSEFPAVVMMRSSDDPWRGKIMPIEPKYSYSAQDISAPVIDPYDRSRLLANVKSTYFSQRISKSGDDSLFNGDIYVDLNQDQDGSLGKVDGKLDDMITPYPTVGAYKNYNPFAFVLGYYEAGGGPFVAHNLNFISSKQASVRVTVHFTQDVSDDDRALFTARFTSAVPMRQPVGNGEFQWERRSASLDMTVSPPLTAATIGLAPSAGNRFWNIDSIEWESTDEPRS